MAVQGEKTKAQPVSTDVRQDPQEDTSQEPPEDASSSEYQTFGPQQSTAPDLGSSDDHYPLPFQKR